MATATLELIRSHSPAESNNDVNSSNWLFHDSEDFVLPGIKWGSPDVLFTPAYWKFQSSNSINSASEPAFRMTKSLRNECVLCLIGGHGISAEIGLLAYSALERSGVLECTSVSESEVFDILRCPLQLPSGKSVCYRFAKQKSRCIFELLKTFEKPEYDDPVIVRNWLTRFRGIGLKTASWIVRNWYSCDFVAILDVHIHRAGLLIGLFDRQHSISGHYVELEKRFIDFSLALGVKASILDAMIWDHMRRAGAIAHRLTRQFNFNGS